MALEFPTQTMMRLSRRSRRSSRRFSKKELQTVRLTHDDEKNAFFWYRYLFLNRGKPTTHILALVELEDSDIVSGCPKVLKRLVAKMKMHLDLADAQVEVEEDGDAG